MDAVVNLNGELGRPDQMKVSVFDRGFLFGDGVYETGTAYDRCPLFMDEHLTRLRSSARKLAIPVPWSDAEITQRLHDTCKAYGKNELYFRIVITRGVVAELSLEKLEGLTPTLMIVANGLDTKHYEKLRCEGVSLLTSTIVRNSAMAQDPNIKTSNYLNSLLALQDVRRRGGDDAVLCNAKNNVAEGTTFSIFGVMPSGLLVTPSLEVGILDSITRRHVIKLARPTRDVQESHIPLDEFKKASEVFIASSVREIVPVVKWDDHKYTYGTVTAELQKALRTEIGYYTESHPKY